MVNMLGADIALPGSDAEYYKLSYRTPISRWRAG